MPKHTIEIIQARMKKIYETIAVAEGMKRRLFF